uniref:Secreted protein n=1 Tax=Nothoprocta perdicaria TaxID=30464 RepID=A0A8C6ZMH2_NOTPE
MVRFNFIVHWLLSHVNTCSFLILHYREITGVVWGRDGQAGRRHCTASSVLTSPSRQQAKCKARSFFCSAAIPLSCSVIRLFFLQALKYILLRALPNFFFQAAFYKAVHDPDY